MFIRLDGYWKVKIENNEYDCNIPGTLDQSGIGGIDNVLVKKEGREFVTVSEPISTRFTRKHSYMGEVKIPSSKISSY